MRGEAKAIFDNLPTDIANCLRDYAETTHDDHVCTSEELECDIFDRLLDAINEALKEAAAHV